MASTSTASPPRRAASPVGEILKTWRRHRRMSQLDLSAATGVTPRHISFVETGRSSPSRELLETLANALDMPLRDRNDLHLAAGFAPPYRELGLDDRELADAMMAIDHILDSHEPLPAVVMDRHWNLQRTNAGAVNLFATMLDLDRIETPANVLEMMFDPQLLRPHVLDWEQLAPALLVRARRESVGGIPDPDLADRLARMAAQIPATAAASAASTGPLIEVGFQVGAVELRFFSTVTTVGTPRDVTLQELRVELFHPADDTTRSRYQR